MLAERGKMVPKMIYHLIDNFDATLITVLLGNNIANLVLSNIAAIFFLKIAVEQGWASGVESIVSTVVIGLITYIFCDTIPKILSKDIPNRLTYILVYIVYFFYIILYPLALVFRGLLFLVHKVFKIEDKNILTKEEFIEEADKAVLSKEDEDNNEGEEELLEKNEMHILKKAFNFDTIKVKDILTPIAEVYALDIDGLTTKKINETILKINYSRIPIYEGNIQNIIGILTIRNYYSEYMSDPHLNIRSVLSKPLFIDIYEKIDDVFEEFNQTKIHLGIVKDSSGKILGMVTMEDVLEQLVGDINEKKDPNLSRKLQ
jgi:CBS domain containing-hemolysin-like protein